MTRMLLAVVFIFCFLLTVKAASSLPSQEYTSNRTVMEQSYLEKEVQANATITEITDFANELVTQVEGSAEFRYSIVYAAIKAKLAHLQVQDKVTLFQVEEKYTIKGRGIRVDIIIDPTYSSVRPFTFVVTP